MFSFIPTFDGERSTLGCVVSEVHNKLIHLLHIQAEIIFLDTHDQVVHLTLYFVLLLLLMRLTTVVSAANLMKSV